MQNISDVIVLGGGLSGLSVAHFMHMLQPEIDVLVLEKSARPGGCIQTFNASGIQAEWGPHGFLNNTPESLELLDDLGLNDIVQQAPLGNFLRYLCFKGRLVALPQSPQKLLSTPLLSLPGKLRLLADLWKKPRHDDQTVSDWASYRFGKGVLPMVDAAVTGTFAGDFTKLSIDTVMPGVRRLEKETGSVLRGLIKSKKEKKSPRKGLPAMLNFPNGMEQLTAALARDKNIQFDNAITKITPQDTLWEVSTKESSFLCKSLVVALPVNAALTLMQPLSKPPVKSIPVAKIINIVMAFSEGAQVPYGFGYLAPEREKRFALGAMFSSHMFPDRAPAGNSLIEVLVGGRRHPERLELEDHELIKQAFDDVSSLMSLPDPPWFTKVLRSESGIPQLEMDHPALLNWRNDMESRFDNIQLCGFGWDGIGMNEMMKAAKKAAQNIIAGRKKQEKGPDVKPVYF